MNSKFRAFFLLTAAVVLLPATAAAKPTYQQARAIYDAMGKTIDEAGLWYKKDSPARITLAREAGTLIKKSEQVFGTGLDSPYRQCVRAATLHQEYISHLNVLADTVQGLTNAPDPVNLFSSFPNAARFGDARAWCFNEIESLR